MYLNLFYILFTLHLSPYNSVLGKREVLPRFIVETGVKPPIFGSYSYDPIKQVFEPLPTQSTSAPNSAAGLRKRVSVWNTKSNAWSAQPVSAAGTSKTMFVNATTSTPWWARAKLPIEKDTTIKENLNTI